MAEFVDWIEGISVLELSKLVKALETRLGVSAAAPVAVAAAGAGAGAAAPVAEQTEFTVVLAQAGAQKIQVIKELRGVTALGLKEAKDLVDGAPKTIKEGISKEEAQSIKAKLEGVGATIEIK
ncbi:MAG: 50S ribosomal protein L7/L12 [Pontiellaceae bacterium]|nr:50S ribosomal protein L7/L12 [Pontiellaceae bacterium]